MASIRQQAEPGHSGVARRRRVSRAWTILGGLFVGATLTSSARPARAEQWAPLLRHELAVGMTGVYDSGYDRGLHLAVGYQLGWRWLTVGGQAMIGDTNPRQEYGWAVSVAAFPWKPFRLGVGFRHQVYPSLEFGETDLTLTVTLLWKGLEFAAGHVLRFPIFGRQAIHNPFVFNDELTETFLIFRLGYVFHLGRGVGLGFLAGNFSRFELQNFDHPQAALVVVYHHPLVGAFRVDLGVGIAGFFNSGATIDRGFMRIEYVRDGW